MILPQEDEDERKDVQIEFLAWLPRRRVATLVFFSLSRPSSYRPPFRHKLNKLYWSQVPEQNKGSPIPYVSWF